MKKERYAQYLKKINNLEQKRINEDKNKKNYNEKPTNNNKEKIIYRERKTVNQFNDIYKLDKLKTELNEEKDTKNKIKEKKLNKNIPQINKTNNITNNINEKLLKIRFVGKALNPNMKKPITNTKNYNYNLYTPLNNSNNTNNQQKNINNQINTELNNIPNNDIYNYKEKYLTINQNNIQNKICGFKKLKNNKYKPINNNIQNIPNMKNIQNNNMAFKTIQPNLNEDIYDYGNVKKTQYKEINNKKDNIELIHNDKYNNVVTIEMNNLTKNNFHKNNSSSSIYCSPNKINSIDNKRTIDDKNFNIYNNFEKIKNKTNYIYKKNHRNVSCIKPRDSLKNYENEFETDITDFKNEKKSISKNKYKELSFNSPISTYDHKKNQRNSVSYLNNNKKISIHNKNIDNRNDNKYFEVSELYNRNAGEKSKYTTIQNSDDELKSNSTTVKNSGKKYYYQTIQDNNHNYDNPNSFKMDVLSNKNKTFKRKTNNSKNNIIYENNVNSFDINYDNNYYDNYDDNKGNLSNYNFRKNYNIKSPLINNDLYNEDSDFSNFSRPKNNFNNKIFNYKNNCSKITKTIRPKKIITDTIIRKKFANSFNNEFNDNENYNFNNRTILNNYKPKNCQKLILDRKLDPEYNLYTHEMDLNQNINQFNNNKTFNNSTFFNNRKNSIGKNSPKYILKNFNGHSHSPTILLENEDLCNNYFYSNNKTKEDFYRDRRKTDSKAINKKDISIESSPKSNKNSLYHKKSSQNHFSINNPLITNEVNQITYTNNICYLKKPIDKSIYHKKNFKNKISDFSTTTENKTLKKEQTDNYSINSSHNSNNNKNINSLSNNTNNNTFSNKKNNNISISGEESINFNFKNDLSYSLYDIKDKVIINDHFIYHKLYNYGIKKPIYKLCYLDKNKKYQRKNKKGNNISINISNISDNKNNDNSFSISFNNNQNKVKKNKDKDKDFMNEDFILNIKNLNSDLDSKDSDENFKKISNIKKNENDFIYNDCINFDLSEEKDEKININLFKKENCLIKRNINNNLMQSEEEEKNKKIQIRTLDNLDINNKNRIKNNQLYNNYLSNSTSKKENKHKNEKQNKINVEKMSLFTKKLSNVLFKKNKEEKNDRNNNYNKNQNKIQNKNNDKYNEKTNNINSKIFENNNKNEKINKKDNEVKRNKIRKSLTEKEFVLGYSKLNDIFTKKSNHSRERNTITFNNNMTQSIDNKTVEEINDNELNDNIKIKQKLYTYKIKQKNKLLEDEEDFNDNKKENKQNLLLLENNNIYSKGNLLEDKKIADLNNNENDDIIKLINSLNDKNLKSISEQIINEYKDKINNIINIIFDKINIDKNNINIYAKLFNDMNTLLLKNRRKKINLGNIIIEEYTKRINNNIKDYNNFNIVNFIEEIISFSIIEINEGFNLCLNLFDNYEKNKQNKSLEECIYLYDFLLKEISKYYNIEYNINNLINEIDNKLENCISKDKKLDKDLKDKITTIIDKRKNNHKNNKNIENNDKIIDNTLNNESSNIKENINKTRKSLINDDKKENKTHNLNNNDRSNRTNLRFRRYKGNNLNKFDTVEKQNDIKQINEENKNNTNTQKINNNINTNNNIDNINENNQKEKNSKETKLISIETKEEIQQPNNKYSKTNSNFYTSYPKIIQNTKQLVTTTNNNPEEKKQNNKSNDNIDKDTISNDNDNNTIKNSYTVTHKKKPKKKSKSSEKRILQKSKENNYITQENKEEILNDYEKYMEFLKKEGIEKKEDIYDELNDLYNWKTIDNLLMEKKMKLEDIIKIYIYDICKNKKHINSTDIFKSNEYIKTIIEYYTSNLSKNQIEILHLNMIEIYMDIDNIISNENNEITYMYEIMGNLLFVLLKNKLYYMKELNNFLDKSKETQINIAKVVKYTIIAAGNNSKQYHNDFKFTKLFNNNDIFNLYVTNEIFDSKNK